MIYDYPLSNNFKKFVNWNSRPCLKNLKKYFINFIISEP